MHGGCHGARVFVPPVNACGQRVGNNRCHSRHHTEPDTDYLWA